MATASASATDPRAARLPRHPPGPEFADFRQTLLGLPALGLPALGLPALGLPALGLPALGLA